MMLTIPLLAAVIFAIAIALVKGGGALAAMDPRLPQPTSPEPPASNNPQ